MDQHNLALTLLGAGAALIGVGIAAALDERADGVIRMILAASFVGTAVAYRRHRRRPDLDPFPIITRWSFVGFGLGLALETIGALT